MSFIPLNIYFWNRLDLLNKIPPCSHLSNLLNETNLKNIKLDPVIIIINNQICRDSPNIFM